MIPIGFLHSQPTATAVSCSALADYNGGASFPANLFVTLGSGNGWVELEFLPLGIPDKVEVWIAGVKVLDTGYIGDASNQSALDAELTSRGLPTETINQRRGAGTSYDTWDDPANRERFWFYKSSSATVANVRVFAPLAGTAWRFQLYCPGEFAPANITANLVAWWDMEEITGSVWTDSSPNGYDLIASTLVESTTTAFGKVDRAMLSAATNFGYAAYLDATDNNAFEFGPTDSFTVFFWHYRSASNSTTPTSIFYLVGRREAFDEDSYMIAINNGKYVLSTSHTGLSADRVVLEGGNYDLSSGWDFIAAGYDADLDITFISVNGDMYTDSNSNGVDSAMQARFAIGARVNSAGTVTTSGSPAGVYDSVGVVGRALSRVEIARLYNNGDGLNYTQMLTQT